jgi:hypothetical protein
MSKFTHFIAAFVMMVTFATPSTLYAATDVATVTSARGEVSAILPSGEVMKLSSGDAVALGSEIKTGSRSSVAMEFKDKSRFELGSNAAMNVSQFSLGDPAKKEPPSFVSKVSVGIFRFVSGFIARKSPNAMKVRGAVATIGIRGTHVVGEFQGDTAKVILLEPEGEPHPTAIDVSNEFGSVTIDEPGYGTEVLDANSAPTPPRRMRMRTINNLMNSLRSVQRMSVPTPRPRGGYH